MHNPFSRRLGGVVLRSGGMRGGAATAAAVAVRASVRRSADVGPHRAYRQGRQTYTAGTTGWLVLAYFKIAMCIL